MEIAVVLANLYMKRSMFFLLTSIKKIIANKLKLIALAKVDLTIGSDDKSPKELIKKDKRQAEYKKIGARIIFLRFL